jgi:hypothetical protein
MTGSKREKPGTATFKIVGAPHMTPYMVSIGLSCLLIAAASYGHEVAISLGNIVTQSHC